MTMLKASGMYASVAMGQGSTFLVRASSRVIQRKSRLGGINA